MGQHVLVPVDGSSQAEKAFDYVLDELPSPVVTVLTVVDPVSPLGYGDEDYFDLDSYQRALSRQRERARELLEEYRERAAQRGIEADTVLLSGKPARRILQQVETGDVDHVVMGSHGRTGVGRVLFGSVAETVTRRAPVPVTIVH